ncbi:MAG: HIT family protein [Patescibacteria group bacterium]|jgi:histidine triad (HIT) family protein
MQDDCIFCKIIDKKIDAEVLYEDKDYIVFSDIHPSAEIHKLIVPKEHVKNLKEVSEDLWGKSSLVIQKIIKDLMLDNFKIVVNNGDKLQMVKHLHIHLVSGKNINDKVN